MNPLVALQPGDASQNADLLDRARGLGAADSTNYSGKRLPIMVSKPCLANPAARTRSTIPDLVTPIFVLIGRALLLQKKREE